MTKGTLFQPRVLQLNLDNINRLLHGKHPDRKKKKIGEFADEGIEPLTFFVLGRHRLQSIYHSETDVLVENVGRSPRLGEG